MELDLEQYRQVNRLTYEQLAAFLGLSQRRHAQRWALGEAWPDADKLQGIVERTGGAVTIDAMHRRRLRWLAERRGISLADEDAKSVTNGTERREAPRGPRPSGLTPGADAAGPSKAQVTDATV